MSVLLIGFTITVLSSEAILRSAKLQSALGRIVLIHAMGLAAVTTLTPGESIRTIPILIFWSGAFLSWFGIRSHIESSILLRMVRMLSGGPATGSELTSRYESYYGQTQRLEELLRAGLLKSDSNRATTGVTRKGSLIVQLIRRLR